MNKLVKVINGLKFIQDSLVDNNISTDKNVIYAGSVSQMSIAEQTIMKDLGWFAHETFDCWGITL